MRKSKTLRQVVIEAAAKYCQQNGIDVRTVDGAGEIMKAVGEVYSGLVAGNLIEFTTVTTENCDESIDMMLKIMGDGIKFSVKHCLASKLMMDVKGESDLKGQKKAHAAYMDLLKGEEQ